jgi:hypothetical protein
MLADLDESIKKLLVEELPIKNGEIDVKFEQPKREWSAKLTKPTVNFFLYDLRENVQLRRSQWDSMNGGSTKQNLAMMKKAPHKLDCFYMITTWAAEPEDEHRLMTRTLMALFRNPFLPDHVLQGTVQHPASPINTYVARHDKLTNPAEVWSALDNEMRPSVSFSLTITLDPWTEFTGPIVRTYTLRAGQSSTLPTYRQLDGDEPDIERVFIGGTVRRKTKDKEPQSGLEVAIKGSGWFDTTDEEGQFRLGSMPPGEYTLVVWPEKGKPREKEITVPAPDGDYDLEV